MATSPDNIEGPPIPMQKPQGTINLGSQIVIGLKIGAAFLAIVVLLWYIAAVSYADSKFWILGIVMGGAGVGVGIAGIFIGNLKISKKKYMPTLNTLLIIVSVILLFIMPIFGSWEDPRTIGEGLWDIQNMVFFLIFAVLMLCYIELAHSTIRFSQIDDYATSHNLKEFNINSVISNYFIWFGILITIITVISLSVLLLQIGLSGFIKDAAPQFGYSLEYNSIYSLLISIALIFVPIGIILTFIFGFFVKSRRSIVVKSKEDIIARRPEEIRMD